MHPRSLEILARIADPRQWRRRARQVGQGVLALSWLWFRAVSRAEVVRAQRDATWSARRGAIRADNMRREQERGAARHPRPGAPR